MITNPMDRGLRVVSFNLNTCFMLLIHLYARVYVYMCVCVCVYIYIYIKSNFDVRKTVLNT